MTDFGNAIARVRLWWICRRLRQFESDYRANAEMFYSFARQGDLERMKKVNRVADYLTSAMVELGRRRDELRKAL